MWNLISHHYEREKMKKFLQEHPINPEYDDECEFLDGNPPEDQLTARLYQAVFRPKNPEIVTTRPKSRAVFLYLNLGGSHDMSI